MTLTCPICSAQFERGFKAYRQKYCCRCGPKKRAIDESCYHQTHRQEANLRATQWRDANPERYKTGQKDYYLRSKGTIAERAREWQRHERNWAGNLCKNAKSRSKRDNCPFDLDPEFLRQLFENQNGICYWTGLRMVPSREPNGPCKPSIDKLSPEHGYTKGNIVLTTWFANRARNNLPVEQFRSLLRELRGALANHVYRDGEGPN